MKNFIKFDIKPSINESNEFKGHFEIGPLETSFGITIGNALRRVLLSNIPGASVFAIKIPKVTHEFQAIDGIKEDITQIILNLKKLVLKIEDNAIASDTNLESWPTMKISVRDKGTIKADDIELPIGFDIVNKDLYICEKTTSTGKFEMEIYAKNDRGFKTFKENQELINTLGIIATDSNFCPILQVSYHVDEKKIRKNEMCDILSLTIATNGAISPSDALSYASQILIEHFEILSGINEKISQLKMMQEQKQVEQQKQMTTPIGYLGLSPRSYNCLERNGIFTLQQLADMTKEDIKKIKNLGKTSLREITKKLAEYGLTFRKE